MSGIDATGLRLALFTDTFLPQLNGVTRTLDRLVAAVRERGGEALTWTTTDPAAVVDPGVRRLASVPFWAYPQLRLAVPGAAPVTRELRRFAPTLVHAATPFGVGLAGRAAAHRLGLPLVSSYHTSFSAYAQFYGLGTLSGLGWSYLRWFHNGGLRTYCPTRAVQRELRAHGLKRTRLWARGVDDRYFHPAYRSQELRQRLGADDEALVIIYVGRLAPEKGLDVALAAMNAAARQSPRRLVFAFAGDGPYAAACRAQAPPGSVFLGRIEGEALSAFYASADLFVFPSATDTFGNVLLEAMASRLPIVAADAPPTRELLGDGEHGMLVPPGDPLALAQAMLDLAADPARRDRLAARGLEEAARHSWDAIFDGLVGDYLEVTGRPARLRWRSRARRPVPGVASAP
ncbi:MAG TPA: glycosyltransferase family 1 protein [Thermoanaerobaculia bacterium]|jgi:glycosyltransferase involved in cell wall biosynthesis|nr:glycosyltransferase family 1 protein [Thermoanaerobaculia bacterium]